MAMKENDTEELENRGMAIYEYIVDNVDNLESELADKIRELKEVDMSGQFLASTARYLAAVDKERFQPWFPALIEGAIEKDRERRYIGSLLQAIWGDDFEEYASELKEKDNNFRRIYRRLHPEEDAM